MAEVSLDGAIHFVCMDWRHMDELSAAGAVAVMLKDAMRPNLVQTLEGVPAFVHGGPSPTSPMGATASLPPVWP